MKQFQLRSGVNWQWPLKQRGVTRTGLKQELGVEFWNVFCSASAFLSQVW